VTRWSELAGPDPGASYAARVAEAAATGADMHGEATLVQDWLGRIDRDQGRVLDAGCGTGRVAIRLAEQGCAVVGVDADPSMLEQARLSAPGLDWRLADLAGFTRAYGEAAFDVVLCAGNVVPLLAPGTLGLVLARLKEAVEGFGVLITGFGLDAAHLPDGCPVTPLAVFDAAAEQAGLELLARYGTWAQDPYGPATGSGPSTGSGNVGYAVSVHHAT